MRILLFILVMLLSINPALAAFTSGVSSEIQTLNSQADSLTNLGGFQTSLAPNGNGMAAWYRIDSQLQNGAYQIVTTYLQASTISADNTHGVPYNIATISADLGTIFNHQLYTAKNGNAILFYSFLRSATQFEVWSVYYDVNSGWQDPAMFGSVSNPVLSPLITADGTVYLSIADSSNNYSLHTYTATGWQILDSNINAAESLKLSGNDVIYRIHGGDTSQTSANRYISFYTQSSNSWGTPIPLTIVGDSRLLQEAMVTTNGDIYAVLTVLDATVPGLKLTVKKLDAAAAYTASESDVFILDINGTAPFLNNIQINTDSPLSLIGTISYTEPAKQKVWRTIHYSDTSGWGNSQIFLDPNDSAENARRDVLGLSIIELKTNNTGRALAMLCDDLCQNIYAKIFDGTSWSGDIYLPSLSQHSASQCSIDNSQLMPPSPVVSLNENDQILAVSGMSRYNSLQKLEFYFVSATGDILSAAADQTCLSGIPASQPGNNPPNQSGNNPASGNSGSSSSGSMSLWILLLLTLVPLRKFRTIFLHSN